MNGRTIIRTTSRTSKPEVDDDDDDDDEEEQY